MSSRPRPRVLIVDDDAAVRMALRLILDDHHDVLEAGDGGTALDLLDGDRVDVMILDLLLPKADGFEVLQRARELPRRVPVVVISALNTSSTAATAMRLGAVDYITKPFDDAQILAAVAEGLHAIPRDGDRRRDQAVGRTLARAPDSVSTISGNPWSSVVDPPVGITDPFLTPIRVPGHERVRFDVAECAGELRPSRLFTAMMAEASRDVERLGYAAVGVPITPFREAVSAYLIERGVATSHGVVLTTSGTSTSLAIVARALASAGDVVAVEHPTWPVALAAFAAAGLRVLAIPVDDEGLRVDLLEAALRKHRVQFVYVQPTFQNPTGVSLTAARRVELLAVARSFNTLIVEDDFAAELAYDHVQPPLRTDEQTDLVLYLKSFSKVLVPALRVAVIVAPRFCTEALQVAQHGLDPFPSSLAQSVVARCLTTPEFRQHVERVRGLLEARWQVMDGALETRMPKGVRWTHPRGGLCTWIELPPPLTALELLADVAELGIAFAPGPMFCVDGAGQRGARLAFGATPPLAIERGVRQLARTIREQLREPGRSALAGATTAP